MITISNCIFHHCKFCVFPHRRDDLAVGAPFHADMEEGSYETGRVHVFYQNSQVTGHSKNKSAVGKLYNFAINENMVAV